MRFKKRHYAAGLVPLALIELSSLYHIWGWLAWGYPSWLALSNALAFLAFTLGAIVAMGLPLEPKYRSRLFFSGLALILCIALANVLGVLHVGTGLDQIEALIFLTGLDRDLAIVLTAILQGGLLSLVSVSMWSIVSKMTEQHWELKARQQSVFDEVGEILSEAGKEETLAS